MSNPNLPINTKFNSYIGARYVPIFANKDINYQWTPQRTYEPLMIVQYQGNSYISTTYVPLNVNVTDTTYWLEAANYSVQMEQLKEYVKKNITNALKLTKNTQIPIGEAISTASYVLGTGWSASAGYFSHQSGSTEPLTIQTPLQSNIEYFIKLTLTNVSPTLSVFSLQLGNYEIINTYNGTNTFNYVIKVTSGSNLIITPSSSWSGNLTINNFNTVDSTSPNYVAINSNSLDVDNFPIYASGFWNIAVGDGALSNMLNGRGNIAIGHNSLHVMSGNNQVIAIGCFTGSQLINGWRDVIIGTDAAIQMQESSNNVIIGFSAAANILDAGMQNILIGESANRGINSDKPNRSVVIGAGAGYNNSGDKNVFIGYYAGNAGGTSTAPVFNSNNVIFIGNTYQIDNSTNQDGDINIGGYIKGNYNRDGLAIGQERYAIDTTLEKGKKLQLKGQESSQFLQLNSSQSTIGGIEFVDSGNSGGTASTRRTVATIKCNTVSGDNPGEDGGEIVIMTKNPGGSYHTNMTINPAGGFTLNQGGLVTSPVNGQLEFDGSHLYITIGGERKTIV